MWRIDSSFPSASWSHVNDNRDENHWQENLAQGRSLHEIYQPMATHSDAHARSRLDRDYTSQHTADQLDTTLGCAPLEWVPNLSAHRPLLFFRKAGEPRAYRSGPLPMGPLKRNCWTAKVNLLYGELLESHGRGEPLQRLHLLKKAIIDTTWTMHEQDLQQGRVVQATEIDDKLGWTIRCIRAAEQNRNTMVKKCTKAYPHLATLVTTELPDFRNGLILEPLRTHAIELARANVLQELRAVNADDGQVDDNIQRNRRSRIQEKIRRLKP